MAGLAVTIWSGAAWLEIGEPPDGVTISPFLLRPEFQLKDAVGRSVTQDDFRGRFLLVHFGYSECPEVCPTTLSAVADVMDALGQNANQVQPLFISIDPKRDAPSDLARYTAVFHPSILGLTGSPGAVLVAAENFHIFFDQQQEPEEPDGDTVAHSSSLYLLGPDGAWLRVFPYGTPAAAISADLSGRLE